MTIRSLMVLILFVVAPPLAAQELPTGPVPDEVRHLPGELPLFGEENPGDPSTEEWAVLGSIGAGVRNLTYPTLTPVLPEPGTETGAGVIVAPGGAFMMLAWEHEGLNVARALADRGIAAFILKYRLIPTPVDPTEAIAFMEARLSGARDGDAAAPKIEMPDVARDGLAALGLVRANAANWGVDPSRVGMMGFSAGAMTSLQTVLEAEPGEEPAFIGLIYGPQDAVSVTEHTPPLFNAIAADDEFFPADGSFPIMRSWLDAGVPAELHVYGRGAHGFGSGRPGTTTIHMIDQFVSWMTMEGFLPENVIEEGNP